MKIHIPEPCHESWDAMTPEKQGRFCGSCCKVVVDFSAMEPEAISSYLKNHQSERVCGRFRQEQVAEESSQPADLIQHILRSGVSYIQKIAAVFLLFFVLSMDANAQAKSATDSVKKQTIMLGRIACPPEKPVKNKKINKATKQPAPKVTEKPIPVKRKEIGEVYIAGMIAR